MKNITLILLAISFAFQSCKKDDPTPEIDQEEVGGAKITFTEVNNDYNDIDNPDVETITFSGTDMLPPVDNHVHLEEGKTYRFELRATDFAGRETQQTFVEREENHFAFILGIPDGAAEVVYKDKKNDGTNVVVGVTGYITVVEETSAFTMRYVMRHLNNNVKQNINTATDWSLTNFTQFTGANDLDLRFNMHFVSDHQAHD